MGVVAFVSVAIASIALIISVLAYRRTGSMKTLDLRIEVRKMHAELHHEVAGLPDKLEFAKKSRERVNAARGMFQSGAMQAWHAEWEVDIAQARAFKDSIPAAGETFLTLDRAALENLLVALTSTQLAFTGLRKKYGDGLYDDDKHRDEIRASKMRPSPRSQG